MLIKRIINKGIYLSFSIFRLDVLSDMILYNYNLIKMRRTGKRFKKLGVPYRFGRHNIILNPHFITVGDNFLAMDRLRLEAFDVYGGQQFSPEIIIGDNVIFNTDCHVGCINKVIIGNNVLFASKVYVSDHSHGEVNIAALALEPSRRALVSAGPVIIGNNVWIGEGVCIFPGVEIGDNVIVGANAVVTTSLPKNAVAAGVPAKVLKILS